MMKYTRKHMIFDDTLHYNWQRKNNLTNTGSVTTEQPELDKHNGYEVLAFINKMGEQLNLNTLQELQELEYLLRYGVPTFMNSTEEIRSLILKKKGV